MNMLTHNSEAHTYAYSQSAAGISLITNIQTSIAPTAEAISDALTDGSKLESQLEDLLQQTWTTLAAVTLVDSRCCQTCRPSLQQGLLVRAAQTNAAGCRKVMPPQDPSLPQIETAAVSVAEPRL